MKQTYKEFLLSFFNKTLEKEEEHRKVGWGSVYSQEIRFEAFAQMVAFDGATVLDVGCGLGALYPFLVSRFDVASYTGLDINARMIDAAQKKFTDSDALFITGELSEIDNTYDYVVASGTLNLLNADNYAFVEDFIHHAWRVAGRAVLFNCLSNRKDGAFEENTFYFEPSRVLDAALKTTRNVIFRHDYLPNDFLIVRTNVLLDCGVQGIRRNTGYSLSC